MTAQRLNVDKERKQGTIGLLQLCSGEVEPLYKCGINFTQTDRVKLNFKTNLREKSRKNLCQMFPVKYFYLHNYLEGRETKKQR